MANAYIAQGVAGTDDGVSVRRFQRFGALELVPDEAPLGTWAYTEVARVVRLTIVSQPGGTLLVDVIGTGDDLRGTGAGAPEGGAVVRGRPASVAVSTYRVMSVAAVAVALGAVAAGVERQYGNAAFLLTGAAFVALMRSMPYDDATRNSRRR